MINISFKNIEEEFLCEYDKINTLVIENAKFYRDIILQFDELVKGNNSTVVITQDFNDYKIHNDIVLIKDYFNYDLTKKINSAIIKSLTKRITSSPIKYQEFYQKGYSLLVDLINDYNSNISISENLDISLLLKLFNPLIDIDIEQNFDRLESLLHYIDALVEMFNLRIIVFVELESFFNKEEIEIIFKHCIYKEVSILILQSMHKYKLINEKVVIIDNDLCEISR